MVIFLKSTEHKWTLVSPTHAQLTSTQQDRPGTEGMNYPVTALLPQVMLWSVENRADSHMN